MIDAYNGSFTYYIIDNDDPIISTYSKIFKGLFKDISEMPESLKEHLRYPETLFKIQNTVMLRYHMTNPNVFYNNEDMWAIPKQIYEDSETTVEPFYAVTRLPNAKQTEFILMRPFTPNSKNNMIGFVVAKCDKENYGKLELYRLPKEKLNYGPMQIEARINQDADISKQLTLWGQKGSKVIRGNMYTIPIKNSILFVESLYIKAETSEMPELKRVILALGDTIVMEENLPMALSALFGNKNTTISPDETGSNKTITNNESATIKELVEKAYNHYQNSENYIKQGNWSAYGQEQLELKNTLEELKKK